MQSPTTTGLHAGPPPPLRSRAAPVGLRKRQVMDTMSHWVQSRLFDKSSSRGKLFYEWESKRKMVHLAFACSSMLGLACALLYFYIVSDSVPTLPDFVNEQAILLKNCSLLTFIATVFFWYHHYAICARLRALNIFRDEDVKKANFSKHLAREGLDPRGWAREGLLVPALTDLLILLPQPLPGVHVMVPVYEESLDMIHEYSLDSLLIMLMFMRLIFIPRCLADWSQLRTVQARALGHLNFVDCTSGLVFRAYLGTSVLTVVLTFFALIITFSLMLMIAEYPMQQSILQHNFANCLWLILITITTVGYGDVYPETKIGRMVAILSAFAAVVCMAFFVNLVTQNLALTQQEHRLVQLIHRMALSKEVRHSAATCIQNVWRAYSVTLTRKRPKKQGKDIKDEATPLLPASSSGRTVPFDPQVSHSVRDFRELRRGYLSDLFAAENDTLLVNSAHIITKQLRMILLEVKETKNRLDRIEARLPPEHEEEQ